MPSRELFGIVDATDAVYGVIVNPEGSIGTRMIGADGSSQAVITSDIPQASDNGIVVKSAELADIRSLLVQQNQLLTAILMRLEGAQ
jgi:hypothetical protein